jgi:hypothetical protein
MLAFTLGRERSTSIFPQRPMKLGRIDCWMLASLDPAAGECHHRLDHRVAMFSVKETDQRRTTQINHAVSH